MAIRQTLASVLLATLIAAGFVPAVQGQSLAEDASVEAYPPAITQVMEGRTVRTVEVETGNEVHGHDQTLRVFETALGHMDGDQLVFGQMATGASAFDILVPFVSGDVVPSEASLEILTLDGQTLSMPADIYSEEGDAEMQFEAVPIGLQYRLNIYGGSQDIDPIRLDYSKLLARLSSLIDPSLLPPPSSVTLGELIDQLQEDVLADPLEPEVDLSEFVPGQDDRNRLLNALVGVDLSDIFRPQPASHQYPYCRTEINPSAGTYDDWVQTNPYRSTVQWMAQQEVAFNAGIIYYAANCPNSNQPIAGNEGGLGGAIAANNRLGIGGRQFIDVSVVYQGGGEQPGPNGFGSSSLTSRGHAYILTNTEGRYDLVDADFDGRNKNNEPSWWNEAELLLDLIPTSYWWSVISSFAKYGYDESFSNAEMDSGPSGDLTQSGIRLTYGALTVQKETVFNVELANTNGQGETTIRAMWGLRTYGSATADGATSHSYDYTFETTTPVESTIYIG